MLQTIKCTGYVTEDPIRCVEVVMEVGKYLVKNFDQLACMGMTGNTNIEI